MPHIVESFDVGPGPVADSADLLREMCRTVSRLLAEGGRPARRIVLSIAEISLEMEWAETGPAGGHPAQPASEPLSGNTLQEPEPASGPTITSPLVGTFYSAPEPGASPFVAPGDVVEAGQQVGIVEAMKLMNPIEADRRGRVLRILVADAERVEFDQPLVLLAELDEEG